MDKKQIITGVTLAVVLVAGYSLLQMYWRQKYPHWYEPTPVAQAPATDPAAAPVTPSTAPVTQPATQLAVSATQQGSTTAPTGPVIQAPTGAFSVAAPDGGGAAERSQLGAGGAEDPAFPMLLSVNPDGAGID